jgi:RNA polymerase sigma factor (TIGR02999 family)
LTSYIDASIIDGGRAKIGVWRERAAMENDLWAPLLRDAEAGVENAKERLFATLYAELHELAGRQLRRHAGASISPTTLLHEAYLDMAQGHAVFPDRARFMGYASRVMRGLISDLSRQRRAQKRGAEFHITQLDTKAAQQAAPDSEERDLGRLSEALDALATRDPRLAELVDLKYFCGFSLVEIAVLRGVSERTAQRDWEKARLVLYREIGESNPA